MIRVGDKTVALRGFSRISVGARLVFDGAGSGAFALSLDPSPVNGAIAQGSPSSVTTQACTAAPSGGVPPYSYSWVKTSGPSEWSIVNPTSQTTAFRCVDVAPGTDISGFFEVTVTDARGRTSSEIVPATASNFGDLGSGGV